MELSSLILLAALSATPQPAAAEAAEVAAPAVIVRAPERLMCRPVTRTGTRIGTSAVCATQEQWESVRFMTLDEADDKLKVVSSPCACGR